MSELYITSAPVARKCLGAIVYWDDVGSRSVFLRSGKLEDYKNRNVMIDGNWMYLSHLKSLRNFEDGGLWAKLK